MRIMESIKEKISFNRSQPNQSLPKRIFIIEKSLSKLNQAKKSCRSRYQKQSKHLILKHLKMTLGQNKMLRTS